MKIKYMLNIDYALLLPVMFLTTIGILFIYSSGITSSGNNVSGEYIKQIIWASAGLVIAIVLSLMNYRRIYHFSLYLYFISIALLLYTCFLGHTVNGAKAWIGIGSFGIQPSEFAKITTIILLAQFLDMTKRSSNELTRFFISCVIVLLPMLLVLIQPDFGTSLVFIPILLTMTFIAGISLHYIFFLILIIALSGVLMVIPLWQMYISKTSFFILNLLNNKSFILIVCALFLLIFFIALFGFLRYKKKYFFWIDYGAIICVTSLLISFAAQKILKEYQIKRLIVFLNPEIDPLDSGWNIIQSITAIGSGGVLGKGYLQGTQSHYRFLPQQSTDFIFSIFSEESGFISGVLVFALFLLICMRLVKIMKTTTDSFGVYIVAGLAGMYVFHFLINVGMVMGIMPITGIPLLFMSYGGSSLISAMIGIGLALSIHMRRFQY
ncbi:MAG: rod shape-determining protein RodA [Spirochaetaceae bacterium]|jgi:rod shape determining protein RodA|nr:rod shape-determining protein RodA [Spirochaetaceae bacterium]